MPEGLAFGSRKEGALSFPCPAGVANGLGNFEKQSSLALSFPRPSERNIELIRNVCQGYSLLGKL